MYKPDSKQGCLAQNIKLFCEANNLTYRDFIAIVGISEATLHNWLNCQSTPDDKRKKLLEKVFDAKFDKICSNTLSIRFLLDRTFTIEDIFPYNCIIAASFGYSSGVCAMLNYEDSYDEELDLNYRNITPAEFDKIFKDLGYREQLIIKMRYQDSLTLDEAGKKSGVTRERVRQIEFKALRKINQRVKMLAKEKPDYNALKLENEQLKQYITALEAASATNVNITRPESLPILNIETLVEDLDFSVRTYNCLKRAQLNTALEIVNYTGRFDHIRNLGKRSLEEIIDTIETKFPAYHYDYSNHKFILDNISKLPEYEVN